ncbi:BQ5605_C003g01832 [Microbotryum silenes-dioicae]|uniref:BQ5605_C003g01832 protein n=1 Tax=Microbotryum silenes-dioicae TaxID=796604 RepID=A0A2X0M478_9BASI|nr:BQ5605_C003g01832 [Microbotryum silenes-dioicae]
MSEVSPNGLAQLSENGSQFNDASHSPKSQPCQVEVDARNQLALVTAIPVSLIVRYDITQACHLPRYLATHPFRFHEAPLSSHLPPRLASSFVCVITPKFSATFIPSFFIRSASTRSLCTRANASSRVLSRNVSVCVGTRRCEARIAVEM